MTLDTADGNLIQSISTSLNKPQKGNLSKMQEMQQTYSQRFQVDDTVKHYDQVEYAAASFSSSIWRLQQPILRNILDDLRRRTSSPKLLDFACGTGRILSFVSPMIDAVEGIDISEAMAVRARVACPETLVHVGDICSDPALVAGPYDLITAFRFILNAEPEVRLRVLQALRKRITAPRGRLLVNVHGNRWSLRRLSIAYRRWQQARRPESLPENLMLSEMSPPQISQLLEDAGFEIESMYGFGLWPRCAYRAPLKRMFEMIDRFSHRIRPMKYISVDLVYVCKPKSEV